MKNSSSRSILRHACLVALGIIPVVAFAQAPAPPPPGPGAAAGPAGATGAPPGSAPTPAAVPPPAPRPPPTPDEAGYIIGLGMGQQLHQFGVTDQVSLEKIQEGLKSGLAGEKTAPGDQQRVQALLRSIVEAQAARNATASKEFLERNGKEKGVKTTASGLQYKVLAAGNAKAAAPLPTDTVTVQYRGKLLDGTEFDSSYKRGTPATFSVNGVIHGWQEALVLMKPGAKWELFVPPELGYGQAPRPGIPGGSLLIFEVELQSVKSAPPLPKAADK